MDHPISATEGVALNTEASATVTQHPLLSDVRFRDLVKRRRTFAWSMTIAMLAIYFAFILTLAFFPQLLGQQIVQGQPTTWGIPVGFGMFALTFALVAVYVYRANSVYDAIVASIRQGDDQ
ncbi:DUF485 domain-containing protein [Burkholderia lata]|uniref:DUF485 domain-containing protein n=1 Tax=Burkholderia lata (strain ATCC 17760 / DSM 23089 / LMG 22485 / NCIMB 9086 / R18194 / 383) TaxID=482957 RepID=Q39G61_BURL3|nr:protein of unknown function DUF485 [Burkholderia lata]